MLADRPGRAHGQVPAGPTGAGRPEQVTENVKAAGVTLGADLLTAIDDVLGDAVERDPAKTASPAKRPQGMSQR